MVKLKDIAEQTGLTVSTVSKALGHSREISRETAQRVLETAKSMGYVSKKAMNRETKTIGVILPEVRSHYYAELMHALSLEIESHGYSMITMLTKEYSADVTPYVERILQYDPDGLVVSCNFTLSEETCQKMVRSCVPTLLLTEVEMTYPLDSICIKTELSVRLAVEHLVQLGHQKIGYLGEYNSDGRYYAFCEILKQNDIELNPCFIKRTGLRFEQGGYEVACELLKEKDLPTAVVTSYDQIAYGAMRAFRERGIRVPEDLSIVGFDNIVMDAYHPVPLTSVTNPVEQMGITAVKILLDAIRKPTTHVVQNVSLQSRLVTRASTCPPREARTE